MRIGFVELLLILLIASLTIGPSAALWVDRWLRRANRASAAAARRRAVQEAQRAAEREEVLQRFQKLSIVFTLAAVAALVWALVLRPIEAPPKAYTAPDHRQASGAAQAELSTDRREIWDLGGYQGVDCIRTRDGLVYAAAWNGSSLKKRTSDLVRTDGGNAAVILSVEGELTGFAFDAAGDLWLTVLTPAGGTLCRARHDSWGASVEQVVTQIDGAPLGALSAVEVGADDYVVKPFSPRELVARVKAVLNRTMPRSEASDGTMTFGELTIDTASHTVRVAGEDVSLTPKEFDLLVFLASNKGIALSREKILQKVWNYDYFGEDRTVDTHVKMLRGHLGKCRGYIATVWGIGYKFDPDAAR